jgi:hypothetical protein
MEGVDGGGERKGQRELGRDRDEREGM